VASRRSDFGFVTDRDDPVAGTDGAMRLLGRKWPPLIVHYLMRDGPLRFAELKRTIDGVSGKVLSETLDDMEAKGLVDRDVASEKPVRVEYSLTRAGESLRIVVGALEEWREIYLDERTDPESDTPESDVPASTDGLDYSSARR
jgi:DNA-binding HxlR family transcriptional regulator